MTLKDLKGKITPQAFKNPMLHFSDAEDEKPYISISPIKGNLPLVESAPDLLDLCIKQQEALQAMLSIINRRLRPPSEYYDAIEAYKQLEDKIK